MEKICFNKDIPVVAKADVVVTGGGLGGVAAAVAASRAGASVVLTETNGFLGGVATAGLCCSLFNCLFTKSRCLKIKGVPLEIADLLATEAGGPGMSWKNHKGHIIYDVEKAKLVLAKLLEKEGVVVLLNAQVTDVVSADGEARAVITAGKNGLEAIECKVLVDATGDCDAAIKAGAEYDTFESLRASYVFRMGNVDVDKFVDYFRNNPREFPENMDIEWTLEEALAQYDDNGTFLFPHGGGMQLSAFSPAVKNGDLPKQFKQYDALDATQMHLIKELGVCHVITGFVNNGSLDAKSLSVKITEGMEIAQIVANCFKKYIAGFENSFVCNQADDLGIRMSRRIKGKTTFEKKMRLSPTRFDDAAGVGIMMQELVLHKGKGAWNAQVFGEDVYEFPLGCLVPKNTKNVVIGAGRGADTEPAAVLRVMVDTMSVGQAAGTVAALASKKDGVIDNVDYKEFRQELVNRGVEFPKK